MRHASLIRWHATSPMTHCTSSNTFRGSYVLLLLLLLTHFHSTAAGDADADGLCLVRATLYVTAPEQRSDADFGLPLDIDCTGNGSSSTAAFDLGPQRVAGKLHVRLNGSQTPPLGVASYGLEYLDNCAQLQSIELERFVTDASLALCCGAGVPLEHVRAVALRHNELGTLSGHSFELVPHMQLLLLEDNALRLFETLRGCGELQQLVIRRERQLALQQPHVLGQLWQLQRLELTRLKLVSGAFLAALPGLLTELLVQETPIEPRQLRLLNGSELLVNLSLVQCELSGFSLESSMAIRLLHLNLSGNALRQLQLPNSSLVSLDLSGNHLSSLNSSWFAQLSQLQALHLQANQLHRVSWQQLLQLATLQLVQLDLSSNQLLRLEDTEHAAWDQAQQLRIQIDDNPWSCQWLLNFSHAQPQLFRLFRYAKYISQINVNGLSCRPKPEDPAMEPSVTTSSLGSSPQLAQDNWSTRNAHLNVSSHTVLYGNPIQQSRSQRAEALIIVFMLPLGIALLFLLLYLYLHCERLFHWSYYSSGLPCFGDSKSARSHRFVDHIDIVRYPIANGNSSASMALEVEPQADGYETPLSGAASICNCAGHRQSACSRTHHVTYEVMPTELPYQLYTEIKELAEGDETDKTLDEIPAATAPIYEPLDEKPLEV
ncbi:uncharacterized protein LOC115760141 [Drosophila novamexicana]|uniref:uncharacterized protein LOC115760141 n=1 Tax=Drosophila novamexicana TaxID=47314 RepID=UPI0011E5BB0E|nr:uncharacterized protein LOC115760141 [Drosophila novamexicana]